MPNAGSGSGLIRLAARSVPGGPGRGGGRWCWLRVKNSTRSSRAWSRSPAAAALLSTPPALRSSRGSFPASTIHNQQGLCCIFFSCRDSRTHGSRDTTRGFSSPGRDRSRQSSLLVRRRSRQQSFRSSFAVWGEDCVICVTDGHDTPTLPQLGADSRGPGNAFLDDISSM